MGGAETLLDGQIVDIDFENPAQRRLAIAVELPPNLGIVTFGLNAATKISLGCEKATRDELKCGKTIRVVRKESVATAIWVIDETLVGQVFDCGKKNS